MIIRSSSQLRRYPDAVVPAANVSRRLVAASIVTSLGLLWAATVVAQDVAPLPSAGPTLSPAPSTLPSPSPSALDVRPEGAFDVRAFDGWAEGLVQPRPNTTLTVELLEGGRLEGQTGCGSYFGAYTLDGDDLALGVISKGPDPCGLKRTEEAVAFSLALDAVVRWVPTPTGIELLDEQGLVRVVLDRPRRPGLTGEWIVERVARPRGRPTTPPQDSIVAISFDEDGSVGGNTGCRLFEGVYSSEADRVVIGPVETVGLPCEGALRRHERRLLDAFERTILWQRSGSQLRLTDGAGALLVELREDEHDEPA